jgi:tetratricopeptide (TPR) repeat protein
VKTRIFVSVMVIAVALYGFMLISLGIALLRGGDIVPALFGLGILAIPALGFFAVVREVRFGVESARLARTLAENDGVPLDTVARDEQGRIDPIAADIEWQRRKALVDQAPEDWRAWFLLGIAYDNAKDRKQARAAIRRAIELFKATTS